MRKRTGGLRGDLEALVRSGRIARQNLEPILELARHKHVFHKSWGIGQIVSIDMLLSRMVVDFCAKPNHSIDLNFAAEILKPRPEADKLEPTLFPHAEKLNWRLLPPGEVSVEEIGRHIAQARSKKGFGVDLLRIDVLVKLKPDQVFVGLGEFDGYLAFVFENQGKAIMENPQEGNAIYIFGRNWRDLSRLSKAEIVRSGLCQDRIIHNGDWEARLLRSLNIK